MTTDREQEKELVEAILRAYGEGNAAVVAAVETAGSQGQFERAEDRAAWASLSATHLTCQTSIVRAALALQEFWETHEPSPGLIHDLPPGAALVRTLEAQDPSVVLARLAELSSQEELTAERFRSATDRDEAERVVELMKSEMVEVRDAFADIYEAVGIFVDYHEERHRQAMLDGLAEAARVVEGVNVRITQTVVMPDGGQEVLRDEQITGPPKKGPNKAKKKAKKKARKKRRGK